MKNNIFRLLVITDHRRHEAYESLYPLLKAMRQHPVCAKIVVISRAHPANAAFFVRKNISKVYGVEVDDFFEVENSRKGLYESKQAYSPNSFHKILLRLPKPNPEDWFLWLEEALGEDKVINRPSGILKTGSKAYLTNFRDLCPPLRVCREISDVESFRQKFPIVLKPLNEAGGRGLIKIVGDKVWDGNTEMSWSEFLPSLEVRIQNQLLAMEYMEQVASGDKRILVVNGNIVGASLRLPKTGSWLCNVNKGGKAIATTIQQEEREMADILAADLQKEGVTLFGFDTLEGNDGFRVLSEVNASNAGGFFPAEQLSGEPVIAHTAHQLWAYLLDKSKADFY